MAPGAAAEEANYRGLFSRFRSASLLSARTGGGFSRSINPALEKLQELLTTFDTEGEPRATKGLARIPRVPPWIAFMGLLLASLFMLRLVVFGHWEGSELMGEALWFPILCRIIAPFLLWFVAWHTWLVRPADFLRWAPTGKAWDSYRRGRVVRVPDIRARFAEIKSFDLLYDPEDTATADRLRTEMENAGAIKADSNTLHSTLVVLITTGPGLRGWSSSPGGSRTQR